MADKQEVGGRFAAHPVLRKILAALESVLRLARLVGTYTVVSSMGIALVSGATGWNVNTNALAALLMFGVAVAAPTYALGLPRRPLGRKGLAAHLLVLALTSFVGVTLGSIPQETTLSER
ncbi:MAG: hypothetical protein OXU20_15625 [Myxococcales bacterium]|nr:hypothetical protein [Myxococcales bacterium]